jgi:DNA-binding transcriptional LysR family regulator
MDMNEVSVFIKVAQLGSFSQAARQLEMPNSTVSSKVSSLEKRLGVTLIQRTTRKLNLTEAGREYFRRCLTGLMEIQAADSEIASLQSEPSGILRVTAPVELGAVLLPNLINEYTNQFPKVQVELILNDRRVELLAEGVDLAIRAGVMKDSTLIAKKIGEIFFAPYASPAYIKANGPIKHPKDLRLHKCLHFTPRGHEAWTLTNRTQTIEVPVSSRIIVNDLNVIRGMAAAGAGIAMLPNFFCSNEILSGSLLRILPSWHSEFLPVHFVYPAQKYVTPKLKEFIRLAEAQVKKGLLSK